MSLRVHVIMYVSLCAQRHLQLRVVQTVCMYRCEFRKRETDNPIKRVPTPLATPSLGSVPRMVKC